MKDRFLRCVPFILLCMSCLVAVFDFWDNGVPPNWQDFVAYCLVGANAILYFSRFGYAVIFTGIIIFLWTFNVLTFFRVVQYESCGMRIGHVEFLTPNIQ